MKTFLCFSLLLAAVALCLGQEKDHFTAAVFEHRYAHDLENDKDPLIIIAKNLKVYEKAADLAASKGTDIIVFSEFGLHEYKDDRSEFEKYSENIPDEYKHSTVNPCDEKDKFSERQILRTLSCTAQKHKMFVVAQMIDNQPCSDVLKVCNKDAVDSCDQYEYPTEGRRVFNTVVAFDREGTIIARYHKNHLYHENQNTPPQPEYVTFKTEFGVFGMFVCFDSVFKDSIHLVENFNVDTVIFPTFWFDNILPLNAIEWQQSWALTNNVNYLAANTHFPGMATLGSGIYSKDHGALVYSYNPDSKSKLLVADVPLKSSSKVQSGKIYVVSESEVYETKDEGIDFPYQCYDKIVGPPQSSLIDYRCIKSQTENYVLEKLEDDRAKLKICHNGFCCSIKYEAKGMTEDFYLAVFNGTNDDKGYFEWAEETCFLVRCDSLDGKACVTFPPRSETVFKYVEMKATFTAKHVYPAVSTSNNRLVPKTSWDVKRNEKNTVVLRYRNSSKDPLLKVALMGRVYCRDPEFVPEFEDSCGPALGRKPHHILHYKE